MSSILYYSTLCKNCDKILNELSRTELQRGIHFVCVDKRVERGGAHFVVLETGEEVLLPKEVTRVPALLLLDAGNRVLFGNEIYSVFGEALEQENRTATGGNVEPRQPEARDSATDGGAASGAASDADESDSQSGSPVFSFFGLSLGDPEEEDDEAQAQSDNKDS